MTFKDNARKKKTYSTTQIRKTTKKNLYLGIKCHEALVLVHEDTNQELF
jgi:hypothetical protein